MAPQIPRTSTLPAHSEGDSAPRPVHGLLVAVLAAALYAPSLGNGFVYDDHEVILNQQPIASAADVLRIFRERHFPELPYYRPVVRTTLLLQKAWHGDDPLWFHAANAGLAGLAAWFAWRLLALPAFGLSAAAAAAAALFVAAHPVASSCVYPIASGRETLLPAALFLAAAWLFLDGRPRRRAAAWTAYALALFSKEQAIVAPALFVLADALGIVPPGRPAGWKAWLVRHGPFAAITVLYLIARSNALAGAEYHWAILDRPAGPLESLAYAVQTVFAPFVELVYEPPVDVWLSPPRLAAATAVLAALAAASRRLSRPPARVTAFWAGWFVLTLLPTANILRQEARFDERYVFLSSVAIAGWVGGVASGEWRSAAARRVVLIAAVATLVACAAISFRRAEFFRDDFAFFQQWVRTSPGNSVARIHLGLAYQRQGDLPAARAEYESVGEDDPQGAAALVHLSNTFAAEGRFAEAAATCRRALGATGSDRHEVGIRFNLAGALAAMGRYEEAADQLRAALAREPDNREFRALLEAVEKRLGEKSN